MNQLNASDLLLLRKAQEAVAAAEHTLRFVSIHIGQTYQLKDTDSINTVTGEITSFEPPAE